jgi:homospermidine synthase
MVGRTVLTLMSEADHPWLREYLPILIIEPRSLENCDIAGRSWAEHIQVALDASNHEEILGQFVRPHAVVFDCSTRTSTEDLLWFCRRRECVYVNTATDSWLSTYKKWDGRTAEGIIDDTLVALKDDIETNIAKKQTEFPDVKPMTAIFNHGMNPGLVSHFVKLALETQWKLSFPNQPMPAAGDNCYNVMAEKLGLTTIQIAERDTQQTCHQVTETHLANTWSVVGLFDEGKDCVQISLGTHEEKIPKCAECGLLSETGQIFLPMAGTHMRTRSYEPGGGVLSGYAIPHAESYSLTKLLRRGDAYRPTVYYSYLIPNVAAASVHQFDMVKEPFDFEVLRSDEIHPGGFDSVGCFMYFRVPRANDGNGGEYDLERMWIGWIAKTESALSAETNATCLQVAVSMLAAAEWAVLHPEMGICEPEDVDTAFIMERCMQWMGDEFFMTSVSGEECDHLSDRLCDVVVQPRPESLEFVPVPK